MPAEIVGAALELAGREAFVAEATAAADAIDGITVAAERASAAIDAIGGSLAVARDASIATAGSTAAVTDLTAAEGGAAGAVAARTAAVEEGTTAATASTTAVRAATKAVAEHESALSKLASNPVISKTATWGTGGLLLGAYETVKQYTNFNKLVTQSAVDAGTPTKYLPMLQKNMIGLAREYGMNINDIANGWYRVASSAAGTHQTMKQQLRTLKDTVALQTLLNTPSGVASDTSSRIISNLMYTKLPGATNPDQIMALINSAVGKGDIRGADMVSAIGKFLPAAKALGASAPSMLAWVDLLTKESMPGSQAGTLIAHSVQQLANPTELGQKAEQMIGIDPSTLKNLVRDKGIGAAASYLKNSMTQFNPTSYYPKFGNNPAGPQSALAQLTAWGILDPTEQSEWMNGTLTANQKRDVEKALTSKIFGGAKSALPMLALMNSPQAYMELQNAITSDATPQALAAHLKTALNTPGRQMQIDLQNIKMTGLQIGQEITPAVLKGLGAFKDVAIYLADHATVLESLLEALTTFVGAAIGVEAYSKIMKVASGLKDIVSTITGGLSSATSKLSGVGRAAESAGTGAVTTMSSEEVFASAVTEFSAAVTRFAGESAVSGAGGAGSGLLGPNGKPLEKAAATTAEADAASGAEAAAAWAGLGFFGKAKATLKSGGLKGLTGDSAGALATLLYLNPEMVGAGISDALGLDSGNAGLYPWSKKDAKNWAKSYNQTELGTPIQKQSLQQIVAMLAGKGAAGSAFNAGFDQDPKVADALMRIVAARVKQLGVTPSTVNRDVAQEQSGKNPFARYDAVARDLSTAARDHNEAARNLHAAGDKTTVAAEAARQVAKHQDEAARRALEAAQKLSSASAQFQTAIAKFASTPITATISANQALTAIQQAQTDLTART